MARFQMYQFDPLPQPAPPDPANATAFQSFAGQELGTPDDALDQAGSTVATVFGLLDGATADVAGAGADLLAAADLLAQMSDEEDPITLAGEVASALSLDDFLGGLS